MWCHWCIQRLSHPWPTCHLADPVAENPAENPAENLVGLHAEDHAVLRVVPLAVRLVADHADQLASHLRSAISAWIVSIAMARA